MPTLWNCWKTRTNPPVFTTIFTCVAEQTACGNFGRNSRHKGCRTLPSTSNPAPAPPVKCCTIWRKTCWRSYKRKNTACRLQAVVFYENFSKRFSGCPNATPLTQKAPFQRLWSGVFGWGSRHKAVRKSYGIRPALPPARPISILFPP